MLLTSPDNLIYAGFENLFSNLRNFLNSLISAKDLASFLVLDPMAVFLKLIDGQTALAVIQKR